MGLKGRGNIACTGHFSLSGAPAGIFARWTCVSRYCDSTTEGATVLLCLYIRSGDVPECTMVFVALVRGRKEQASYLVLFLACPLPRMLL